LIALGLVISPVAAAAEDCDPGTSQGGCLPQGVAVQPSPAGGLRVQWQIFDEPPPNSVSITRTTQSSIACNQPLGGAKTFSVPSATSFVDDPAVTPGVLYGYAVCSVWDNGTICAQNVCQGLPGPSGSGNAGGAPVPPSNLQVSQSAGWATPTHWQHRVSLMWQPGRGADSFKITSLSGGTVYYTDLPANTSSYDADSLPPGAAYRFIVCGYARSKQLSPCTNAVDVTVSPLPAPKPPVALHAFAQSQHDVMVSFASGDDDVSHWFDVQREDINTTIAAPGLAPATVWTTVPPRIEFGSKGFVDDKVQTDFRHAPVQPLTYRVCAASSAAPQSIVCSLPFQAVGSKFAQVSPAASAAVSSQSPAPRTIYVNPKAMQSVELGSTPAGGNAAGNTVSLSAKSVLTPLAPSEGSPSAGQAAALTAPAAAPAPTTYQPPKLASGRQLYACDTLDSKICGAPVAMAFCRKNGLAQLVQFKAGHEKVQGETLSGQICGKKKCNVFDLIVCGP
jgi:hypothetical protein